MAELLLEVKTKDETITEFIPAAIQFVPDNIRVKIGEINDDLQTCDVDFELRDDGVFNRDVYLRRERIIKGTVRLPASLIAQVKQSGELNNTVINMILETFNLEMK